MNQPDSAVKRGNRLTMLGILALFVVPILVAQLFVAGVFDWHGRGMVNRGDLIAPPVDLTPFAHYTGISPLLKLGASDWAAVVVEPGDCAGPCEHLLDELLTIREVLGEGADRLSVHGLAATTGSTRHAVRIHADPAAVEVVTAALRVRVPGVSFPAIVLVDWRHQLMMHYAADAPPLDIKQDLKRLLRASAIR
jgi:hypothetical protein